MARVRADNDARYALRATFVDDSGSVIETDTITVGTSEDPRITATQISNWDTAYGWGDHASAGYLTAVPATYASATATELNGSVDLDDLNAAQAGFYYQTANADTPGNNYPSNEAGSLLVQKSAGNATQMYITYNGSAAKLYFRANYTSGYGSWLKAWDSSDFSSTDVSNWNTAYGWGDHSIAGYMETGVESTTDLNSMIVAGSYRINNTNANRPADWGQVLVARGGSDTIGQLYFDYSSSGTSHYIRGGNPPEVGGSGSWAPWQKIWTTADFTSLPVQSGSNGGNFGSVYIDGGATGGYEGYSIGGRAVFMHNNNTVTGLYNDVNNHWLLRGDHNGPSYMYQAGVIKGYTYASGFRVTGNLLATSNVYAYYSDERLKTFTGAIESPLEKIAALHGVYYTHNDKARELGYEGSETQVGLIAQEVKAIMPECIGRAPIDDDGEGGSVSGEDYMTVDYPRLVPLLVEGIKELTAKVERLEEQLNAVR